MHKLFVLSHLRTLQRLGLSEFIPNNFEEVMKKNNLVASGEGLLYRLPREELKHIVHTPCPINSLQETHAQNIIKSSKLLRHHLKIDQAKLCAKCPFAQKCNFSKKTLENAKYQNTIHDLLNFFHGLQNHLKPDTIFYRQWVSAYRLGDSLIASIDDLSKGGKQIQEYDLIRLEGIKQFQQRMAQKKLNNSEDNNDTSKFENVMSKLEKFTVEKPKPKAIKPKEQKQPEMLGRDFSFDQEEQFEPTTKFSKASKQTKEEPKGYQKIENKDQRYNKNQSKAPYKSKSDRYSSQPDQQFQRYQPKQDKPYRKEYQREDRGYVKKDYQRDQRGDKGQWSSPRNTGYQKQYQSNRYGDNNDRYNDRREGGNRRDDRGDTRGQYRSNDRYQGSKDRAPNSYANKYENKPKYQGSEEYPKIREFGKKSQYRPRQNFNQEQFNTKSQKAPFVSKWRQNQQFNSFDSKPTPSKPSFKKDNSFQGQKPKIIEVQNIETNENDSSGRGRTIRRRRSSSKLNEDEN